MKGSEHVFLHKAVNLIDKKQVRRVVERTNSLSNTLSKSQGKMTNGMGLSDRELDVLNCLARGQTTLQIGSALFISENTVKTHIRHILEKLQVANRTEAVSKAIQLGLIPK